MAERLAKKTQGLGSAGLGEAPCVGLWVPRLTEEDEVSIACWMLCLALVRVGPTKKQFQGFSC